MWIFFLLPTVASTSGDGAVSGALPEAEAFAVQYPGYPDSPTRAANSLGGLPTIAMVRSSGPGARLELRFRPEDPYCHPAFGEPRASAGLVLRLSRPKGGGAPPRAQVVACVRNAYLLQGRFSKPMIETLRLQLKIRFLSLCPNEDTKNHLTNAHELIERSKKQEALCRSEQLKESKDVDEEAPAKQAGSEDQMGPNNSDSEDVDDEEGEDKSDGYDSPPMAEDVRDFTLHDSYTLGKGFSNRYLEEVLRSFPLNEDGQNKLGDALDNAEASDGEFEIFEQPSDDEEYSDG